MGTVIAIQHDINDDFVAALGELWDPGKIDLLEPPGRPERRVDALGTLPESPLAIGGG